MRFTVFTPTYNRGNLLSRLYDSLCIQDFRDFEWIIVDDGSVDDTEQIVRKMQDSECGFPIIYKKVENGGKHRAWNRGVEIASGELFFGCDSDDNLTRDALEITDLIEKSIPEDEKTWYAGVCGQRAYRESGKAVGMTFTGGENCQGYNYMDMTHLERLRNNVIGDKAEVFYTSVWRKYRYQEFEGENFLTESTSLNRMAEDGLKIRFFNHAVKEMEYLADGLTANSFEKFRKNPQGWGLHLSQQIKYGQLTGRKKYHKIWEYYDSNITAMSDRKIADNLNMNVVELRRILLANKICQRLPGRK